MTDRQVDLTRPGIIGDRSRVSHTILVVIERAG